MENKVKAAQIVNENDERVMPITLVPLVKTVDGKNYEEVVNKELNNLAPALVQKESGTVIASDMVSPVEHNVLCSVESENLINGENILIASKNFPLKINAGVYTVDVLNPDNSIDGITRGTTWSAVLYSQDRTVLQYITKDNSVITESVAKQAKALTIFISPQYYKGKFDRLNAMLTKGGIKEKYIPFVDVSQTELYVSGKNLLDESKVQGLNLSDFKAGFKDGVLYAKGTKKFWDLFQPFKLNPNIKSVKMIVTHPLPFNVSLVETSTYRGICVISSGNLESNVGKLPVDKAVYITASNEINNVNVSFNLQLQLSGMSTDYESYKEPVNYPVLPDGSVPDVTSISPNMTMFSNTEGVLVNAQYNLDLQSYLDKNYIPKAQVAELTKKVEALEKAAI